MKIEKYYNKKERKEQYRARFQLNNKEFYPVADTRRRLLEIVDEIRAQEHRVKYELPVPKVLPTVSAIFDRHLATIRNHHQKVLATRVFDVFLSLFEENLKINELKKAHFQQYIEFRLAQVSVQTKHTISPQTVNRELSCIGAALEKAPLFFAELEDYHKPVIPKAKVRGGGQRRERLVNPETELNALLGLLRRPRTGKQTEVHEFHRRRLADYLEFKFLTGMRRKEIFALKKSQYEPGEHLLRNVRRWKTDSVTKIFPLEERAAKIVESRMVEQDEECEYLFSPDGSPVEANYRTLKIVCAELGIAYGRYTEGGFVTHDLRHNFATEIVQVADPETAREFLGHASLDHLGTYLHTDAAKMKAAMRRKEKALFVPRAVELYKLVRRRKISLKNFIEKVKNLSGF